MDRFVLHFGGDSIALPDGVNADGICAAIDRAGVDGEPRWIDIAIAAGGDAKLFISPGVPIWIERQSHEQVVPRRLR